MEHPMPVRYSRETIWRNARSGVAGTALVLSVPGIAIADEDAQTLETGRTEFLSNCAECHGADGKGQGPMSRKLKIKPADLTILARRNNGMFLRPEIYRKIDGRYGVGSHPDSAMPVWGCRQGAAPDQRRKADRPKPLDSLLNLACDSEARIRARISAIVDYLGQIQEK
jgi:mono/diheme cytochrome c family protein